MSGDVVQLPIANERFNRKPARPAVYGELAVTTNFSFLRGASDPEDLVETAKHLGLAGLGIADRNSVAGVVRAHVIAQESGGNKIDNTGFKVAVGARLVFSDDTPDILAYPRHRAAWGRLTRLLSLGKLRAEKGDCILGLPDLLDHMEGLNLVVMPPPLIHAARLGTLLARLKTATPRSVWLAAGMLYRGDDARRLARLIGIADTTGVPLIAVNDVLYHEPARRPLQDVVTCVREHLTLAAAGRKLEANAERHLKSPQDMARLFRRVPEALDETVRFLESCNFSLEELRGTEYADETRQGYATPQEALVAFAEAGLKQRYGEPPPAKVRHGVRFSFFIRSIVWDSHFAPFRLRKIRSFCEHDENGK